MLHGGFVKLGIRLGFCAAHYLEQRRKAKFMELPPFVAPERHARVKVLNLWQLAEPVGNVHHKPPIAAARRRSASNPACAVVSFVK